MKGLQKESLTTNKQYYTQPYCLDNSANFDTFQIRISEQPVVRKRNLYLLFHSRKLFTTNSFLVTTLSIFCLGMDNFYSKSNIFKSSEWISNMDFSELFIVSIFGRWICNFMVFCLNGSICGVICDDWWVMWLLLCQWVTCQRMLICRGTRLYLSEYILNYFYLFCTLSRCCSPSEL